MRLAKRSRRRRLANLLRKPDEVSKSPIPTSPDKLTLRWDLCSAESAADGPGIRRRYRVRKVSSAWGHKSSKAR